MIPQPIENERIEVIEPRFPLVPFADLRPGLEPAYLIKGIIPRVGLTVVWGPPKCGKSFWTFDVAMHVALGWDYRGRPVQAGPVVYCAFEGATGFRVRAEAFRLRWLPEESEPVPFYLSAAPMDLVKDHGALVASIRVQLDGKQPAAVVLDTLNRSLAGSESKDEDMSAYIRAADAIRDAFECAVIVVHHCGVDVTRPRGHTSLLGAADAELSVKRDTADNIVVVVEKMKDGPEGETLASRLEAVEVGADSEGAPITSRVIVEADAPAAASRGSSLTKNQQTMFSILHDAGTAGLSIEEWNDRAREAGIGTKRKADLYDIRESLRAKHLVRKIGVQWVADR